MTDVDRLLKEYVAAHRAREDVDPGEYLSRAQGAERKELAALIDAYLARAPRREFDPEAYRQSGMAEDVARLSRSLTGASGLWPSLLPRLRTNARLKRSELVARLASALGVRGREDKVADYYHQMEQGLLPAEGVSDSVLEALAGILGRSADALREAGRGAADGGAAAAPATAPAFTRMTRAEGEAAPGGEAAAGLPDERWDEVDELFRGRS
jgi:hypothetical protein